MPCPGRDEMSVGPGPDAEHWDRFFALSEETINDALLKLFEQRKEIQELVYNSSPDAGVLKARVFAPRVQFEPEHKRCVTLVVPIRSGMLEHQGVPVVDLEGWKLAVNIQLSSLISSSRDVIKMENGPDRRPTKLLTGEYSIYRLLAALSEAPWTLNEASSTAFYNRWLFPLPEHLEKNVEPDKSAFILGALKEWATNHATSDFYTLGLGLKLPTLKDKPLPPTHKATSLYVQLFYYVTDDEYDEATRQAQKPQGSKRDPFGCLVFCERINSRPLPEHRGLEFTANLANPHNTLYLQPEGVLGTAAIHRNVFFRDYLLPELQTICAGIHLVPLKPLCWIDDSKIGIERFIIEPRIFDLKLSDRVSEEDRRAIEDARPADPRDSFYAFRRKGKTQLLWEKVSKAPGNRTSVHKFEGRYPGYYDETTTTSVKIKVLPGKSQVVLKAKSEFVTIHNQKDPRHAMTSGTRGIASRTITEFKLVIKLVNNRGSGENGIITPVISNLSPATGLPSGYVCDAGYWTGSPITLNGRRYQQDGLEDQLTQIHKNMFSKLTTRFKGAGRFVCPATFSLDFDEPKITNKGDLCWHLQYRPLNPGRVSLRPQSEPLQPAVPEGAEPGAPALADNPATDNEPHGP